MAEKKNMNYVLFDSGGQHGDRQCWQRFFAKRNLPLQVFKNKGGWGYKTWLNDAIRFVNATTCDDVLICWADIQGVFAYWYSMLTFKKRKIVIVNILLKNKSTLKNMLVAQLYKKALNAQNTAYTVTSKEYGESLCKRLHSLKPAECVLHDLFTFDRSFPTAKNMTIPFLSYIFSGGRNGRDWSMVYYVARKLQDRNFCLVMTGSDFAKYASMFENMKNCSLYHDIPFDEYCSLLQGCDMGYFPLDTQAPAGLTALFQAVCMKKPVLTSNTETTREYFSKFTSCIASDNVDEHCDKINRLLTEPFNVNALIKHLSILCGEEQYMQGIEKCISKVKSSSTSIYPPPINIR